MATTVTNRVRERRAAGDGLTQQQLAEAVGVSRQTIIAIESGRYCPSLEVALKIARVFGQPVEAVFSLAPEQTEKN